MTTEQSPGRYTQRTQKEEFWGLWGQIKSFPYCGLRNLKTKWILPGNQEEPSHCLFCPHSPFCSFHLQPLFTHFNVSDSGADGCHVTRTSERQKLGNEGSFSAEAEWASPTSATIAVDSIAAALAWKSAREFPWYHVQSFWCKPQFWWQMALYTSILHNFWNTYIYLWRHNIKEKKILMLLLIWQCFSCNLINEESLTSLTNIWDVPGALWKNPTVFSRSERLHF